MSDPAVPVLSVEGMIAEIIRKEGGYNDIKEDKGGATNKGISLRYLRKVGLVRGDLDHDGDIDKQDIMLVDDAKAFELYRTDFYLEPGIDKLPPVIQPIIFDIAVGSGPPRGIMLLQKAMAPLMGFWIDSTGVLDPVTVGRAIVCVKSYGAKALINGVVEERLKWYDSIIKADPTQAKFRNGWRNRANSFRVP